MKDQKQQKPDFNSSDSCFHKGTGYLAMERVEIKSIPDLLRPGRRQLSVDSRKEIEQNIGISMSSNRSASVSLFISYYAINSKHMPGITTT